MILRVSLFVLVLCGVLVARGYVRLNTEPSVPLGLWWLHAVPPALERGMVVLYPPPAAAFPVHPWWLDFLKPIAALPGDTVCVDVEGLTVRGEWYGVVHSEVAGYRLSHIEGCLTVQPGEVFVASKRPRSHDSRYYNSIKVSELKAVAVEAWVGK